uniref:Uncharacterized protein n=1 Tax=viral metagenome TaxID=1070528 RepID=A0A6M3IMU8_9ZZZZ
MDQMIMGQLWVGNCFLQSVEVGASQDTYRLVVFAPLGMLPPVVQGEEMIADNSWVLTFKKHDYLSRNTARFFLIPG